jgi:hypothetical protein
VSIEIEVGALKQSVTAYDKDMNLTVDGQEVRVILHWDSHDGYEATWLDLEGRFISAPEWANKIDDEKYNVNYILDIVKEHTKVRT